MDRLILLFLALFVATFAQAADSTNLQDWKLVSDRNDIQVYMKHRDESRLKTFRGVTRFDLADEYSLVALLNDYASYPKWLHFVDSAEEFDRVSPLDRSLRFTTQLPWPLADREAVLRAKVTQTLTAEEESVMVDLINRPDALPPNNDYIRFPEMTGKLGFWRLEDNEVEMTYELILDPGGYIPAWIANILLRDAPYFTLERLRRIVSKPEYQNHYYDYLDLRGPGRPASAKASSEK
tara:strand:+ start:321 stop:1031 length:711 start_codon:yes stop_codon:yes gene_type:complete